MATPAGDRASGLLGLDAARSAGAAAAGGAIEGSSSYAAVSSNSPPQSPTGSHGNFFNTQVRDVQVTDLCSPSRRKAVISLAATGLLICAFAIAVGYRERQVKADRSGLGMSALPPEEQGALGALGVAVLLPWETTYTTTTTTTTASTTSTTRTATSTTSTTRTKTSTVTNTTTTTSTTETTRPYPSVFCFSVMQADGYELSLLRNQLAQGVSIFQCDDWAVYSDTKVWLTPGPPVRIDTEVLDVSLEAPTGQIEHILNTDIFIQAFNRVHRHPRFDQHDFFVKIDPDAVFFPDRLKTHLKEAAPEPGSNLYFWNCPASFKLFGAIEVFSKEAMVRFFAGLDRCKAEFDWEEWGEDLFLRRCMDMLGVEHKEDYGLLTDAYCGEQPSPCTSGKVAFHPFKAAETYFKCLEEATAEPTPAPPAVVTEEPTPAPPTPLFPQVPPPQALQTQAKPSSVQAGTKSMQDEMSSASGAPATIATTV